MASKPPTARPNDEGPDDASSGSSVDDQTVNLQVVSPSVGVNRPLLFPGIAANTTVKQLKERIRQTLPLRPPDEHQRLIHRGRAIVRESDTLLDIFGADAVSCFDTGLQLPPIYTFANWHLVFAAPYPRTTDHSSCH